MLLMVTGVNRWHDALAASVSTPCKGLAAALSVLNAALMQLHSVQAS